MDITLLALCAAFECGLLAFLEKSASVLVVWSSGSSQIETTIIHWGFIGTMEKNMETTIVHWGDIGIGLC